MNQLWFDSLLFALQWAVLWRNSTWKNSLLLLFSFYFVFKFHAGDSSWYNCTGWLGVKHQFTYLLTPCWRPEVLIPISLSGYHASMDVYVELQKVANNPRIHSLSQDKNVNICVGKEWYRFPSHFFLPSDRWVQRQEACGTFISDCARHCSNWCDVYKVTKVVHGNQSDNHCKQSDTQSSVLQLELC